MPVRSTKPQIGLYRPDNSRLFSTLTLMAYFMLM